MDWIMRYKTKIALIAGVLLVYIAIRNLQGSPIQYLEVSELDHILALKVSGVVVPQREIILSYQAEGLVAEVAVSKGEMVKAGQVLMRLDDRQAVLVLQKSQASLEAAQIRLQKGRTVDRSEAQAASIQAEQDWQEAVRTLDRYRTLAAAGAVSQEDLEKAEKNTLICEEKAYSARLKSESYQEGGASLALLANDAQKGALDVRDAEMQMEWLILKSPCDGLVLDTYVIAGELMQKNQKAVRLGAGGQTRIHTEPDQQYLEVLTTGMPAQVSLPGVGDRIWPGWLSIIEPSSDASKGTLSAEVDLGQIPAELIPGRLVEVVLTGTKPVRGCFVENQWITNRSGISGVWIEKDGRAHFVPIKVGNRNALGMVVSSGLANGDRVLQPGEYVEGQKIKTVPYSGNSKV